MEAKTFYPSKKYPYMAVWVGRGESLAINLIHNIKVNDIVIISMVDMDNSDKQIYVQPLLGGKQGYITKREDEYCPLPNGYSVTLCQ